MKQILKSLKHFLIHLLEFYYCFISFLRNIGDIEIFFYTRFSFILFPNGTIFSWLFSKYSLLIMLCTFLTIFIRVSSLETLQTLHYRTIRNTRRAMFNAMASCGR